MPAQQSDNLWFSTLFGIEQPQYELPFVDFSVNRDVPLYVDPYAIAKDGSELSAACAASVVFYFQCLLDAIIAGDNSRLRTLVSGRLTEPSQICLGVSTTPTGGRGIGAQQEAQILLSLRNSRAAKEGAIQALQEVELHVEGIGPDKISDLVANIILNDLAQFTEETCQLFGVPTRPCPVNGYWNCESTEWDAGYYNLPSHGTRSFVLVPKRFIRRGRELMNHREFYDKYILDSLQRELLSANESLVQALRSCRHRVTKKAIREDDRFKLSKGFISEFIVEHPTVIGAYRAKLSADYVPADPAVWSGKAGEDDPDVVSTLAALDSIQPGRAQATEYHESVFKLIRFVFDLYLENFECEFKMDGGRGRIDIIADNYASGGFFGEARRQFRAWSVPIECKNYVAELGNVEFNQIADRLGHKSSQMGFVFCRKVDDRAATSRHVTDRWLRHGVLILVFDDAELKRLVQLRLNRDFRAIDAEMRKLLRIVQYGNPD